MRKPPPRSPRKSLKSDGQALAVTTDVADPASIAEMIEVVEDEYGRIDVLINNAGIFSTLEMRPFDQIPLEEWEQVLRVNLTGPFLCARAVLPAMRRAKWGRIINIASGAVRLGRPNYLHYIATKSALVGMSLSMARELGPDNITVNAILPGATFTEIERKTVTPAQKERIIAMQCVPRAEVPEDLVGAVLFLASEASAFVTGQSINLDGGVTHPLFMRLSAVRRISRNEISFLALLVPQHQANAFDAVPQRQPADGAEFGMFAQHARQTVIRNPAAQMMHMMNADIGGEPAQDAGQHVIRAAVQRDLVQIPVLVVRPTRCASN